MQPSHAHNPEHEAANDNTQRPAAFDAAVLAELPYLRRIACRLEINPNDREDLVQTAIMYALQRWANAGNYKLRHYLYFQMRYALHDKYRSARAKMRHAAFDELPVIGEPATQDGATAARHALGSLGDGRDETALVRLAMGDTLEEIGDELGVTRERVRQITDRARRVFAERVGYRRVA